MGENGRDGRKETGGAQEKRRCVWCIGSEEMMRYHDTEWGVPVHDDRTQFEFLTLEVMQCGLNWNMMIKKREIFRECFCNFEFDKIADFKETDIERIMNTEGMIRSVRKIRAVIENAKSFQRIIAEHGSFDSYLWGFCDNQSLVYRSHQQTPCARNELSDAVSADLKKRGFRFVGSVTVYSHLQACGIINDHESGCWMYEYLIENYPVRFLE